MKARLAWISLLLLLALPLWPESSLAQNQDQEFIPESGHWVSGDFLTVYRSIPNPDIIYGYPITEAFLNPITGRIVQYFQKAHFELRTENPPELRVHRTLLGEYLYQPGQSIATPPNSPGCRSFPETDQQVCYAFLKFFEENGGISQFGFPISDIEIRNERIVQYFQRALFEWHPERHSGKRVVIGDLGWQYFWSRKEDPQRLLPPKDRPIPHIILNLKVRAYPSKAVLPSNDLQTLVIIVQDQNLSPIAGADVYFTLRYPTGREALFLVPDRTDKNGVTQLSFRVVEQDIGIAEIVVTATYDKFQQQTTTSFRLWW